MSTLPRRTKYVYLSEEQVLMHFLGSRITDFNAVNLRSFDLPEGYEILRVIYDPMHQSWVFAVYHPSWPIVLEGEKPPTIEPTVTQVQIARYQLTGCAICGAEDIRSVHLKSLKRNICKKHASLLLHELAEVL